MTKRNFKAKLNNDDLYERSSGGGCLFFFVVLLIAATAGSIYLYLHLDQIFPKHEEAEEEEYKPPVKEKVLKEADIQVIPVVKEEPPPPPPPPRKSIEQMKSEADAAQAALDKEIDAARKASMGNEIPSFAGIKFGDVMNGLQISTEAIEDGKDLNESGYAVVMIGPTLKAPFRGFGKNPTVKVTPKTKRIFYIEFSQNIARKPGWTLNDETTNLVAMFTAKFNQKPFSLDTKEFPLGKHEFVFPRGETTLTIGEYGGTKLKMILEHAGIRESIKEESAELRKASVTQTIPTKALTSDKYPNSGMVKFGRVRVKNGTPKSFCGIVFGSLPPYGAKTSIPKSASQSKSFYIDYRKSSCEPFANFYHGKAEISSINNAVTAVKLYSEGAISGLSDSEYFEQIRNAIERRYKIKPSKASEGPIGELTYEVGDLEIVLGPDKCGGFALQATNKTLKEHW